MMKGKRSLLRTSWPPPKLVSLPCMKAEAKVLMAKACAIFDTVAWLRVQFCWRHISTIKRS